MTNSVFETTEHMQSFFTHKNVENALPSSADFMLSECRVNSATKFNGLSLNARLCPISVLVPNIMSKRVYFNRNKCVFQALYR